MERRCLGQGLLFEFEIGVQIDLGGFHGFVAQPKSDDRSVDSMLEQIHRQAVSAMPLAA